MQDSVFERHPKKTALGLLSIVLISIIGLCQAFHWHPVKQFKQFLVAKVVDHNVGRFILLKELSPNREKYIVPEDDYRAGFLTLEKKSYKYKVDEDGYIYPSKVYDKPDFSVVFLGGSTTECRFVDEENRFPYLVGKMLSDKLNLKINSYNSGVSGNESMHSINILLNKVLPLKPKVVVLMHNINDLNVLRVNGNYFYQKSYKSHLQTSEELFSKSEYGISKLPIENAIGISKISETDILNEFKANLHTFVAIAKARQIIPVLMTQANRIDNDKLYHQMNQVIRDVSIEQGITLIDLAKAIPSQPEYIYDTVHLNNEGSKLAAKVISEGLVTIVQ